LERAIAYFEQVVHLDPSYAPAWASLSKAQSLHAGAYGPFDEFGSARHSAEQAITLDPDLADGHAALGQIKFLFDWDWASADAEYQRALELEKGNAEIVQRAASLAATLNRFDDALALSRRSVELDPLEASSHEILAFNAWWGGHLEEAQTAARRGVEMDPRFPWLHSVLSRVYLAESQPQQALAEAQSETAPIFRLQQLALANYALGRTGDADKALAELVSKYKTTAPFQVAEVYAFRRDINASFEWLDRAYAQRDDGLTFVKGDPLLLNLQRDERYAALLRKMRLLG